MRLRGDRVGHFRVCMAERVDGNARGEVEIALAVRGGEPAALPLLERKIDARESRQKMSGAHGGFWGGRPPKQNAPPPGGALSIILCLVPPTGHKNQKPQPGPFWPAD